MKISLGIVAGAMLLSTAALAQTVAPPAARTQEGRSDAMIGATAPNSAIYHKRLEHKPPADSTQKSQGGQASPTAESK